eukprot:TRINITY_DN6764_c1_g1_i2.p1 TRINITY_DN6764_c1_g1~~TRINITY_DN6764_c1_g1_i2.p1  ORF type:complete len:109 (-),score=23.84 TRINITY_DN6764_c1_g1_i2:73-399(-)
MRDGELACLYLRACQPQTLFVGTRTSGGLATCTLVQLPGAVNVTFSCLGFRDSEGNVIHGEGISPNIVCRESIEDVKEGRDVILQMALKYLKNLPNSEIANRNFEDVL